jgi:hypothetical protein
MASQSDDHKLAETILNVLAKRTGNEEYSYYRLQQVRKALGQKPCNPATMSGIEFNKWLDRASADELALFGSSEINI